MTIMTQEVANVATTIHQQINIRTLMSLGATELHPTLEQSKTYRPGLAFTARILPFTRDGERGTRPRRMKVSITLDPSDTYTVAVTWTHGGKHHTHFLRSGVYADQLDTLLLALDYDGDTAVNPRLA